MRRPEFLARQSRCPSGLLGAAVGRIMAHETARENAAAVDLLNLQATDHVLEVGFGHGRTLAGIAARAPSGFIAGVDASSDMLRLATRVNRNAIAHGLLELKHADSQTLPFPSHRFDKLLSVHTLYFWKHPIIEFREFRRVLRDGGKLVLGFKPKDQRTEAEFPAGVYTFRTVEEVCRLLSDSDFSQVAATEFRSARRVITLVTARAGLAPAVITS
jgi:ubiquinone/menaquinone biosynthesis C-methylase UbiE